MCGRLSQVTPSNDLTRFFELESCPEHEPRHNLGPGSRLLAIIAEDSRRVGVERLWGLLPGWAKDRNVGFKTFNARSETVDRLASFRAAFARRRCLIPADGFYEWQRVGKSKQPYYFSLEREEPLALAGLWESWRDPRHDETLLTCTVLTTAANRDMAGLHDRMPLILPRETWETWLDAGRQDRDSLDHLLRPPVEGVLRHWPVSDRVNKTSHEGADLIVPLAG